MTAEILADGPYAYYRLDDQITPAIDSNFSPASISGLVAWINPDALGLNDGGLVSGIDAVGTGPAWTVPAGASAPIYKTGGLNGRSYIQTAHASSGTLRLLVCDVNLSATSNTVVVVARMRGTANGRGLSGYRNNWILGWWGGQEDVAYALDSGGWYYGSNAASNVNGYYTPAVPASTSLRYYVSTWTTAGGNDGIVYRNGIKVAENSVPTGGPHGITVGGSYQLISGIAGAGEASDTDYYEVLAWNRVLTAAELANVHDYVALRHKTQAQTQIITSILDSSGNGRTAVVPGGQPSRRSRGLNNRGFSLALSRAAYTPVQTPFSTQFPEFTLEAVVRPEGVATTGRIFSKSGLNATAVTDFPISVSHLDNGKFEMILSQGNDYQIDATITSTGTYARDASYHLVAVVRNSGVCSLYVNGVLDGTTTIAFALSTNARPWTLGATPLEAVGSIGSSNANRSFAGDATTIDAETVRLTRAVNSLQGTVGITTPVSIGPYFRIEYQTECSGGAGTPADGIGFNLLDTSLPANHVALGRANAASFNFLFLTYTLNPQPAHAQMNGVIVKQDSTNRGIHDWVFTFTRVGTSLYDVVVTRDGVAYVTGSRITVPETAYVSFTAQTGGANDNQFVRNLRMSTDTVRFNGRAQHWAFYDKALTGARILAHAEALGFKAPLAVVQPAITYRSNGTPIEASTGSVGVTIPPDVQDDDVVVGYLSYRSPQDIDPAGPGWTLVSKSPVVDGDLRTAIMARRVKAIEANASQVLSVSRTVSTLYESVVLADAPFGYYRLGEASGVAEDSTANNRDLTWTISGSITRAVTGLVDSPDKAVTLANNAYAHNPSTDFNKTVASAEIWFRTSNAGSGHRGMIMRQHHYGLFLYDNMLEIFDWGGGQGRLSTGINCADGLVHHAVVTYQSGVTNGTKIYLDGVLRLTTTATNNDLSGQGAGTPGLLIGSGTTSMGTQNFAGTLDEGAVYDYILTPAQILNHYNVGKSAQTTTQATQITAGVAAYSGVDLYAPAKAIHTSTVSGATATLPYGVRVEQFIGPETLSANYPASPSSRTGMDALFTGNAILQSDTYIANINQISPTGVTTWAGFPENVRKRFTGLIYLDTPGTWSLGFDSDDAGDLDFEGQPLAFFYAGRGVTTTGGLNFGNVTVATAGWYRYQLRVQNTGGPGGAVLGYRSPAMITAGTAAALVPASMLAQLPLDSGAVRLTSVAHKAANPATVTGGTDRTGGSTRSRLIEGDVQTVADGGTTPAMAIAQVQLQRRRNMLRAFWE